MILNPRILRITIEKIELIIKRKYQLFELIQQSTLILSGLISFYPIEMQSILVSFFDDLSYDVELRVIAMEKFHLFAASDVLQGFY